jgi:DNA polymerase III delta prime subunit
MYFQAVIIKADSGTLDKATILNLLKDKLHYELTQVEKEIIIENEENSIGIEELREIMQEVSLKTEGIKLLLINSAEKLTTEAQNYLLKTVEEPYEQLVIVLVTKNIQRFLETILSRTIVLEINDLVKKDFPSFYSLNFADRIELIDNLANSRLETTVFIENLLRESVDKKIAPTTLEEIVKVLKGIKRSANIKAGLNKINILLRNIS